MENNFYFQETMNFQLLLKMSGDACTSKTLNCAPVIHYEKSKSDVEQLKENAICLSKIL